MSKLLTRRTLITASLQRPACGYQRHWQFWFGHCPSQFARGNRLNGGRIDLSGHGVDFG